MDFSINGVGTNGRSTERNLGYGASKAGYIQFTKTLNKEISLFKNDIGNIKIHILQPGMVMTELMLNYPVSDVKDVKGGDGDSSRKAKPIIQNLNRVNIFNALVEEHDVVTEYLVGKVRGIKTNNIKAGQTVEWLTKMYAVGCIVGGLFFGKI